MISTITPDAYEHVSVSSQQMLPAAPFPRKYVHCVFDDPQDAMQAFLILLAAGYKASDIHVLTSREYVEAIEQGQTLMGFLTSIDLDEYLHEARRGRQFLVVRPCRYEQMEQVRDILAPHHPHLMNYVDTWTVVHLLP